MAAVPTGRVTKSLRCWRLRTSSRNLCGTAAARSSGGRSLLQSTRTQTSSVASTHISRPPVGVWRRSTGFQPGDGSAYSTANQGSKSLGIVGGGITGLAAAVFARSKAGQDTVRPEDPITVYEQKTRFGGWLQSNLVPVDENGGAVLFETGPRTLRVVGNGIFALSLLYKLGLKDEVIMTRKSSPEAANRYIYYPDHLVNLPDPSAPDWARHMLRIATQEPALQGIFGELLREPFRAPRRADITDESIADFLARRFSSDRVDKLVSAIFHGVYAGDVYDLSARSLLKSLWRREKVNGSLIRSIFDTSHVPLPSPFTLDVDPDYFLPDQDLEHLNNIRDSKLFTFRKGLQQFSDALVNHLKLDKKTYLRSGSTITNIELIRGKQLPVKVKLENGIERFHSSLVWAGSPKTLADVANLDAEATAALRSIPTVTVCTVNLYYREQNLNPPGFGYLIPLATSLEQNPESALGVVFDNMYSAHSSSPTPHVQGPYQDTVKERGTKLTVMLGGHYWNYWKDYPSESDCIEMAKSVLARHLGITTKPVVARANINHDCIPQYTVGHHKRLQTIHESLLATYSGRLSVAGPWIDGVGVNDSLASAAISVWGPTLRLGQMATGLEKAVNEEFATKAQISALNAHNTALLVLAREGRSERR